MIKKINLQLFAENQEVAIDEKVYANEEARNDDASEINKETIQEKEEILKTVPESVFLKTKSELKELKKQLRELQQKETNSETNNKLNKIRQLVKDKGYDDDLADVLEKTFSEVLSSIPKTNSEDADIIEDIQDFAYENPEVKGYEKDIIAKIKKFKKAGEDLTIEEAFALIKPSKVRINELKTDIEQKNLLKRREIESKKVEVSTSSSPKDNFPLDEHDKKALAKLQDAQPNKNWDAEKYYKIMKTN